MRLADPFRPSRISSAGLPVLACVAFTLLPVPQSQAQSAVLSETVATQIPGRDLRVNPPAIASPSPPGGRGRPGEGPFRGAVQRIRTSFLFANPTQGQPENLAGRRNGRRCCPRRRLFRPVGLQARGNVGTRDQAPGIRTTPIPSQHDGRRPRPSGGFASLGEHRPRPRQNPIHPGCIRG